MRSVLTDEILTERKGHVLWVTFNRPQARNAMKRVMYDRLAEIADEVNADDNVRVVMLTGAGDKAFVSGADISEFGDLRTSPAARAGYDRAQALINRSWSGLGKPVIAMIRGFCLGAGLLIALQADIRIAADDSQFAIPAARLGLGFGLAGVTALANLVGPASTAEILLTARRFPAADALRMGLVNRVVAASDLRDETMTLARAVAQNAPLTLAACKAAIRETGRSPEQRDTARVEAMIEACFRSDDYREGQRAFAEKRPPAFTGH